MRAMLREGMAEGAFGLSSGLDYPPGSYATHGGAGGPDRGRRARRRLLPHPCPVRAGRSVPRPFREALAIGEMGHGPVHLTHFYHRRNYPGGHEPMLALVDDARAAGQDVTFDTYPYEWASTRLLIQLPQWVQAGGPSHSRNGWRTAPSGTGCARRCPPRPTPRRAADLGRRPARRIRIRREPAVGGADPRGRRARDRPGSHRRHLRPPARRGSPPQPGDARAVVRVAPPFRRPSGGDGGHRLDLHRSEALAADLRVLPAGAGAIRSRRSAPLPGGGRAQDDLRPRRAAGPARPGPAARRLRRGHRRLRPGRVRSNATYDDPRQFPDGIEYVLVNGVPWWMAASHRRPAGPRPAPTGATRARLDTMRL